MKWLRGCMVYGIPDFVDQKIAKGDIDAENGIEGAILFPVGIGPWGMTLDNNYHNEALNAAYNSYLMTQYYEYTMDQEFLESGVYDYMKQAVAFYEAWLEKEDSTENEDGYEYVLYAGYNEGSWAVNPAVELAALKGALKNLIWFSEELGKDEDKRADWIEIYEHLGDQPTTTVNRKTVLALGEKQWNGSAWTDLTSPIPGDGNALPLDSMIPGEVYNYFSSPEDLQMIRDTIDVFSDRGAWSQINNFSRLFPEAVKSRYPIDTIVTKLVNVIDSQMAPNLRINDGAHGIEKSGSTETVNSMMLISEDGITKIFPNWYEDKDAKFVNLRAKGAFTVSAEYDGEAQEAVNVTVTSEAGEDMTLVSPWAEGMTVRDSDGNIVGTEKGTVPNWEDQENATYTFATEAGETYTIEKGEPDPVNLDTLKELLADAKEHVANGDVDQCIEAVQKLFDKAIAEAEAVIAKGDAATAEEVDNAEDLVSLALHSLSFTAPDKAALKEAIDLGGRYDLDKYVEDGKAEFTEALEKAKEVYENGNALQEEVTSAWQDLVDAISELRLKADKTNLEELLKAVEGLDLSIYTDESVAVYRTALAAAQAVMDDESLSIYEQKTVDDAVAELQAAKDGLTEKSGSGSGDEGDGDETGGDHTGDTGDGSEGTGGQQGSGADAPNTGDEAVPFGMMAAAVLAAGAAAWTGVYRRKCR